MQTLLIVAVVVIALAVITQAGALLAMYLLSRRVTKKVEVLMAESHKVMTPLESVTSNLKAVTNDLAKTGELAREQVVQIQKMITETHTTIRGHLTDVRERVLDTVDEARQTVMGPVRQYSSVATAVFEAFRTLFRPKREREANKEHPAA
jgi:hypothetical protein